MNPKLKYTIYFSHAIEHSDKESQKIITETIDLLKKEIVKEDIFIYFPLEMEAQKTGKSVKETGEYISGLKRGGHWERFYLELGHIWWGNIKIDNTVDKIEILQTLRNRMLIDGNELRDTKFWGDMEAVVRANFIIALLSKNSHSFGAPKEIVIAELFNIPVYLILPDQSKTEANSTLIDTIHSSGGEVFYSTNELIKFIKSKYNI